MGKALGLAVGTCPTVMPAHAGGAVPLLKSSGEGGGSPPAGAVVIHRAMRGGLSGLQQLNLDLQVRSCAHASIMSMTAEGVAGRAGTPSRPCALPPG